MSELQGQCMCGAVTVTATPARDALGACHCDQCRRWTSSMLITFPAEHGYAALGPVKTFTSSDWAERLLLRMWVGPVVPDHTAG
ncbi:hypothetical protein [Ruegeria profundi]|uniref:GFA family protein n=1 Tax=Ruegeria profundi TaxID=1685378 RepID=UPI000A7C5C17